MFTRRDYAAEAKRFMKNNPEAFRMLCGMARLRAQSGRRFSFKELTETLRKNQHVNAADGKFKLNNSHTAHLARLVVAKYPGLANLIEMRGLKETPFVPALDPTEDIRGEETHSFEVYGEEE